MENAQPEPSMEEILASIRRIISDDEEEDAPAGESTKAAASGHAKPELAPNTQKQAAAAAMPGDDDGAGAHLITEDVEMIKKNVAAAIENDAEEAMLDKSSAAAATQAFHNLSQTIKVSDGDGRTLEDIVIAMLKPMIKEWLDANLPAIVEDKVEEEVQRVARRRG